MSTARFGRDRNRVLKSYKVRLMGELKSQQTMSDSFIPNPTGTLFLASPSPTIPMQDHIPEPFPMSVPTSPTNAVVRLPPALLPPPPVIPFHTLSPPSAPASPPTTLTHLKKRAIRTHRSITRSGSESSGEVKSDGKGKVEGPINMMEPWIEGPKSAKVSDPRFFFFSFFVDFLSIKNCRLGTVKLGRPASCTVTTKR